MKRLFCVILAIAVLLAVNINADAYFGDSMTDVKHFSLGISGEGDDHNTSLTALLPLKFGWLGFHHSLQTRGDNDDMEITNHTANIHLQGVYNAGLFDIEGYVEGIRNMKRDIDHAIGVGYFIRPAKVQWNQILFSLGAGNWTQRVQSEIGRDEVKKEAEARVGWLSFLSATIDVEDGQLSSVVRYKPSIDFETTIWELSSAFNYPISSEWLLGFMKNAILEDDEMDLTYQLVFTYTPGK